MQGLTFLGSLTLLWGLVLVSPTCAQIRLLSYTVSQQADSAEFTFTFNASVVINENTPCFFNRLSFETSTPGEPLVPEFPGTCQITPVPSPMIRADLDPRDYVRALRLGIFVTSASTSRLLTVDGMESDFLPSLDLVPVEGTPLPAAAFTSHTDTPNLASFDLDWSDTNILLLLHFSDIMDISTYDAEEITLSDGAAASYQLTELSRPIGVEFNLVKTVCVTISRADTANMQQRGICTNQFGSCRVTFSSALISSFVNVPVQPANGIRVSRVRNENNPMEMLSVMRLSVSYIGCDVEFSLRADEVYTVRSREYVNRVSCAGAGSTITFGANYMPFDMSMLSMNEMGTSVEFPNGIPMQYFGLFSCVVQDQRVIHYVVNTPAFIGLPSADQSYTTRLYNSLSIPFYFGSDPQLNLLDGSVEINMSPTSSGGPGPSPPDPTYRRLSPYRAEVVYAQATYSISTMFQLRVLSGGRALAMTNLRIGVTPPTVNITPSAIALLPTDQRANLQCITNNPNLPVFWTSSITNNAQVLGSMGNYTLPVPAEGGIPDMTKIACHVRNPEDLSAGVDNSVAVTFAVVTNIPRQLSVFNGEGEPVMDQSDITIRNRLSGNLTLRCLGHAPSSVRDLMWVSEQNGRPTTTITPNTNSSYYIVSYGYNEANLTVVNLLEPYRGVLRCVSRPSGLQVSVFINDGTNPGDTPMCPAGDADPRWSIQWSSTEAGRRDSQPCPTIQGTNTTGFAFRECGEDGKWEEEVDVINCRSAQFEELENQATGLLAQFESLTEVQKRGALTVFNSALVNLTSPRVGGLFPSDLATSLEAVTTSVSLQTSVNIAELGTFNVIDNLLDESNVLAWSQLNEIEAGGRGLLQFIQQFGMMYTLNLVNTSNMNATIMRDNLYLRGYGFEPTTGVYEEVEFPPDSAPGWSNRAQVTIPAAVLREVTPQVMVGIVMANMQNILPQPTPDVNSTTMDVGASVVLSVTMWPPGPMEFSSRGVELEFLTESLARASNPRCFFWNASADSWETEGVRTLEVAKEDIGEFKTFRVRGNSSHLGGAFAVLAEQDDEFEVFEPSVQFYVGCCVALAGAILAMLALFFSCSCDRLRKYSVSAYLTHMSFCAALVCSFITLMAGVSPALENMAGCIATSALLHYFFTAAFAWMFCEMLAIVLFPWVSRNPGSFTLFFILGWGLPAIPVAISLGVFREDYISTTHCWFYFDGEFVVNIVVAFIIPKLALTVLILFLFVLTFCSNCRLCRKKLHGQSNIHIYLMGFESFSVFLVWLLLSIGWVFAVFHVNGGYEAVTSTAAAWVFMVACIVLGFWIFIFAALVALMNQKIDYEVMWEAGDGFQTFERKTTKKKTDYSFNMSDLSFPKSNDAKGATFKDNPLLDDQS